MNAKPRVEERVANQEALLLDYVERLDRHRAGRRAEELTATVERIGRARAILSRCESETALQFGRAAGFAVFQGWHIDALLAAASRGPRTMTVKQAPAPA
ncbi:MAG: hypothetical protein ACT4P2_02695 [Pseudomonadota bacterium]